MRDTYTAGEADYVESVVKYGIYDGDNGLAALAEEDEEMYKRFMELFKDDIDRKVAEGKAEGMAEGEAERKRLQERIEKLEVELKKAKVATL